MISIVALLAPVANDPIVVVSPLVLQSPMTTLEPRAYMPLIMCDDCQTVTPYPTSRPTPP
jgi:hypothetical protein